MIVDELHQSIDGDQNEHGAEISRFEHLQEGLARSEVRDELLVGALGVGELPTHGKHQEAAARKNENYEGVGHAHFEPELQSQLHCLVHEEQESHEDEVAAQDEAEVDLCEACEEREPTQ